jgi:hypothetical protein
MACVWALCVFAAVVVVEPRHVHGAVWWYLLSCKQLLLCIKACLEDSIWRAERLRLPL